MSTVDDLMATVTRLGNDTLVAQAAFALENAGLPLTADICKAAFIGAAHVAQLAEKAHNVGTFTTVEMLAAASTASLSMQIWATEHDILTGNIQL
jgi:hypothetical protein